MGTQTAKMAYLQLIRPDTNNNRFYRMRQDGNIFVAEFGRNGATPVVQKKPMSLWDAIYEKKIREGYVETKELHAISAMEIQNDRYIPIRNSIVREFFETIMHYADRELKTKYLVKWTDVTPEMIEKAQELISRMDKCRDIEKCRKLLMELFAVIPRKMKDVENHLPSSPDDMDGIVEKEQELLDVLVNKIVQEKERPERKKLTILDAMGLDIREVTDKEREQIIKRLSAESAGKYKRAFRVRNKKNR